MSFFNFRSTSSDHILDATCFQFLCWNYSCSWARITYPYPLPVYSLGLEKEILLLICVLFLWLVCFTLLMVKNVCNIFDHFTSPQFLLLALTLKERNYLKKGLKDSIFLLGYRSLFPLRIFSDISRIPEPKSLTLCIHEGEMLVIGHPGILSPPSAPLILHLTVFLLFKGFMACLSYLVSLDY